MSEVPITVTKYGSLKINDAAVLDLSRGEAFTGAPFESQEELLEHLGVNLIGGEHRLSLLDGWADLPDDAVTVRIDDVEAEAHEELAR
jgi:hypothetical protein